MKHDRIWKKIGVIIVEYVKGKERPLFLLECGSLLGLCVSFWRGRSWFVDG